MIELLQTTTPSFQYDLCVDGDDLLANGFLCTAPRIYRQEWFDSAGPTSFWYDFTNDRYVLQGPYTEIGIAGSGNSRQIWTIDPETGLLIERFPGQTGNAFNRHVTLGSYNLHYLFRLAGGPPASPSNSILECDNLTGIPSAIQIAAPVAIGTDYGSLIADNFHINRNLTLIAIPFVSNVQVWDYNLGTLLHEIAYPNENSILKMLYESDEITYVVMDTPTTGVFDLVKMNTRFGTVETYTQIQAPAGTDNEPAFAFDIRRKILAVYHQRTISSPTGANQDLLEFYKVIPEVVEITDPVPFRQVRVDERIKMISHVLGDHGEAGVGTAVKVTNSGSGTVLTPNVTPVSNGSLTIDYEAPSGTGTDTITNTAEV